MAIGITDRARSPGWTGRSRTSHAEIDLPGAPSADKSVQTIEKMTASTRAASIAAWQDAATASEAEGSVRWHIACGRARGGRRETRPSLVRV